MTRKPPGSGKPTNTPDRVRAMLAANTRSTETGCLLWTARRNADGYVQFRMAGKMVLGHRVAYEFAHGPLSSDQYLDHVCHTQDPLCPGGVDCDHRACLNPEHLEPVERVENTRRAGRRKAFCRSGHLFTPQTTYIDPKGHRYCRTCNAASRRRSYERKLLRAAGVSERAA